jgi:hypothetical protein
VHLTKARGRVKQNVKRQVGLILMIVGVGGLLWPVVDLDSPLQTGASGWIVRTICLALAVIGYFLWRKPGGEGSADGGDSGPK